jgi:hypothetical protein
MESKRYRQISVLKHDDGVSIFGPAAYHDIRNRKLNRRLLVTDQPVWRLYLATFNGNEPYPTITSLTRPALLAIEKPGPCVAKGSLDKIWPLFMAHVRMI